MEKPCSIGIVHRRHSGESRNPEPMRIKVIRHFMFSLHGWEKAKSKVEKAKSLDSGMRRNDEQNRTSLQGQVATCPLPPPPRLVPFAESRDRVFFNNSRRAFSQAFPLTTPHPDPNIGKRSKPTNFPK
ncbi:MAG: hypothetical protein OXG62_08020 [Nitrospinae bacterium]|nr:hypothetical protein [Nitrospinota bacterium]